MPKALLGPWLLDFSAKDCGWLADLGPSHRLFFSGPGPKAADARVICRPMGDGFAEDWSRDELLAVPSSSLRLIRTDRHYLATQFVDGASEPAAVAVSDHLFRDTLLWFDACMTRDQASRKQLAIAAFLCTIYPFFLHYVAGQGLGLLLHTSAVRIDGRIWLFAGRSGAGKSTFSRLWAGQAGCHVVNDDRALVRPDSVGTGFAAHSVPWIGEDRMIADESAPLAGICFLHQSRTSESRPLSPEQALRQLLQVAAIPWYEPTMVGPALEACDRLLSSIPAHELHFRPDQSAIDAVLALASH